MAAEETQVVKAKTLVERVSETVAKTIGDLVTPDDLKEAVDATIHKVMFEERMVDTGDTWSSRRVRKPPLVEELVEKHLGEQMRAAIDEWIRANPEAMREAVDQAIANGVAKALMRGMDGALESYFHTAFEAMRANGLLGASGGP